MKTNFEPAGRAGVDVGFEWPKVNGFGLSLSINGLDFSIVSVVWLNVNLGGALSLAVTGGGRVGVETTGG